MEGRQKLEDRRVSSKNDLILCTNDATGHDMMQATIDINGDGSDNLNLNGHQDNFVVKFSDVTNSPPTDLALSSNTINENVAANIAVGNSSRKNNSFHQNFMGSKFRRIISRMTLNILTIWLQIPSLAVVR